MNAGVDVRFSSWRFPAAGSTRASLVRMDVILFVGCVGWEEGGREAFERFLRETLGPLGESVPRLRILNGAEAVLWNVGEGYISDLEGAGFKVVKKGAEGERGIVGWSLVFLGTPLRFSHGAAGGDDGVSVEREELPWDSLAVGNKLCKWLEGRFGEGRVGYVRIDGVVGKVREEGGVAGGFEVRNVNLIEPELWLDGGDGEERVERFLRALEG